MKYLAIVEQDEQTGRHNELAIEAGTDEEASLLAAAWSGGQEHRVVSMDESAAGFAPVTYYGGKQKMVPHILPLLPKHVCYCEPFFGGGAVYWAKNRSINEVINDRDNAVITFYRVAKTQFRELQDMVRGSLFSRTLNLRAWEILQQPHLHTDVERAWAFWAKANMGYSGLLCSSFGYTINTNDKGNRIETKKAMFETDAICRRLEHTTIESRDALDVIRAYDGENTFFYADPPYFNADEGHYGGYTESDFSDLLGCLREIKGKFVLSSYPSPMLDEWRKACGWLSIDINLLSRSGIKRGDNVASGKLGSKIETLTFNYINQSDLFGGAYGN